MYEDFLKRKETLIISAIEILDEEGFAGMTTKSLAKREGISEPAIYRQFDSKLDIILAILDKFSAFDEIIRNTIIEQKMEPRQAIEYFLQSYAGYYQNYPQITTVMFSLDLYRYDSRTNSKMMEVLHQRHGFLETMIKKGQAAGVINREISPEALTDIVWGQVWSLTFWWKFNNQPFDLKERLCQTMNWIFR